MFISPDSVPSFDFEGLEIRDYTAGRVLSSSLASIAVSPGVAHRRAWSRRSDKYYFVVSGTIEFELTGNTSTLTPGCFCHVPRGERFSYRNATDQAAEMLLFHTPGFDPDSEVFEETEILGDESEGRGPMDTAAEVTLREVTTDNLYEVLRLDVKPEQAGRFVATNAKSLAEAHFYQDNAWYRAIYAGDTLVGFLMLWDDPDKSEYYLWRLMIDGRYQGLGYGRRALELVIEHVRTRPGATELTTGAYPGEGSPISFYEKMGFALTGETDPEDGELKMRLDL